LYVNKILNLIYCCCWFIFTGTNFIIKFHSEFNLYIYLVCVKIWPKACILVMFKLALKFLKWFKLLSNFKIEGLDSLIRVHFKITKWTTCLDNIQKNFTIDGWKCLKKTKLIKQKKQPNGNVQSVKLMFIFKHP
jgi:hypothetical protein